MNPGLIACSSTYIFKLIITDITLHRCGEDYEGRVSIYIASSGEGEEARTRLLHHSSSASPVVLYPSSSFLTWRCHSDNSILRGHSATSAAAAPMEENKTSRGGGATKIKRINETFFLFGWILILVAGNHWPECVERQKQKRHQKLQQQGKQKLKKKTL